MYFNLINLETFIAFKVNLVQLNICYCFKSASKYLIETGFQSFTEAGISKLLDALSIFSEIISTHFNTVPTFIKLINLNILYFIFKISQFTYRDQEVSSNGLNFQCPHGFATSLGILFINMLNYLQFKGNFLQAALKCLISSSSNCSLLCSV